MQNNLPLTSYAQNFEDIMLWRALKHVENGFYIDVGAHSPNIDSVSRLFYENGWRGVHVEPVAKWAEELRQARAGEKVVEAIVGADAGTGVIYVLGDSGLNTTHLDIAKSHQRNAGLSFESSSVNRLTLDQVFAQSEKTEVHWLKIDVEGDEAAVVKGWNREKYRPWVVVIEATNPSRVKSYDTGWEGELIASRYELVYADGLNKFFISREHVDELRSFYEYPPNVFDNFAVSTGAGPWGREAANAVVRLRDQLKRTSELEIRIETDRQAGLALSEAMQALIDLNSLSLFNFQRETEDKKVPYVFVGAKHQGGQLGVEVMNGETTFESRAMIEEKDKERDVHVHLLRQMTELSRQNLTKAADRISLAHEEVNFAKSALEEQKKFASIITDTINQLSTDQRALIRLLAEQTEKRDAFEQKRIEMQRIYAIESEMQRDSVVRMETALSEQVLINRELKEQIKKGESSNTSLVDQHESLRRRHHLVVFNSTGMQDSYNNLVATESVVREELRLTLDTLSSAKSLISDADGKNQFLRESYLDLANRFNALLGRKSWKITRPFRKALATLTGRQFTEPNLVDASIANSSSSTFTASEAALRAISDFAPNVISPKEPEPNPSEYQLAIVRESVHRDWLKVSNTPPLVSIVILQYMKSDLTINCVRSILKFTDPFKVEIIVVDNGSKDEHIEALIAQFDDLIKIVRVGVNRYFGEGNNIGVEASRGTLVAIMNNDIVVTKGWLEPLIYQLSIKDTGAVGPCFVYPDGRTQECGGFISADGAVEQRGKGATLDSIGLGAFDCDYISAALLLIRREDYLRIGGFDLCYEPAYYEDVDLCFKLASLGLRITCVPIVKVFHNENATSADPALGLNLSNIVAINATKFYGRWGSWLKSERKIDTPNLIPKFPSGTGGREGGRRLPEGAPKALIYTPYALTPGGGEKYILTIAEHLLSSHEVTFVTHHCYSEIRIKQLAHALNLALDGLKLTRFSAETSALDWDIAFVLGNSIAPPFSVKSRKSYYICQFPFDFRSFVGQPIPRSEEFEYVCYSEFVRSNICKVSSIVPRRVRVVSPQVDSFGAKTKKTQLILSVGRFFEGGHCKNQHLLIEAFGRLVKQIEYRDWRLALAGSTRPEPEHRAYYQHCKALASNLNVDFYPDVSHEALSELYAQAQVYWHGAGIGVDEEKSPEQLEHFGISPLEAVSAGCSVYVWHAGGPSENASAGVPNMVQFSSIDDLIDKMLSRVNLSDTSRNEATGFIASHFGTQAFHKKLSVLIGENFVESKFTHASV